MSEHFRSDNVVRMPLARRERRRLWRTFSPPPRRSPVSTRTVGIAIVAAISAGLAAGLGGTGTPAATATPDDPILWNETQAVPAAELLPEDRAWEARASGDAGGDASTGSAERSGRMTHIPYFGFCHVGGGAYCVVDGDTFYHERDKIRIANIDAPETHPPRCASEARLGKAATNRLHALLNAGEIRLSSIDRDTDPYGRKLRNVAVGGADVGETLVGEGLARPYAGGRQSWCS